MRNFSGKMNGFAHAEPVHLDDDGDELTWGDVYSEMGATETLRLCLVARGGLPRVTNPCGGFSRTQGIPFSHGDDLLSIWFFGNTQGRGGHCS